ncbi:MAG: hypothetical protein M3Y56_01215 [Armatimonadota bacterium]|nr:hypothetical protein [Armatimonadota bacterium]
MSRNAAVQKILKQGMPDGRGPLPVLSLEDFFIGNHDEGSIGCNLRKHPGIDHFYKALLGIRNREDVQDVLIEVIDLNELDSEEYQDEEDEGAEWPFSERVYLLTTATVQQVEGWVQELGPDDVAEGWSSGKPPAAPVPNDGFGVISVWWD